MNIVNNEDGEMIPEANILPKGGRRYIGVKKHACCKNDFFPGQWWLFQKTEG